MKKILFLFILFSTSLFAEGIDLYFFWGEGCSYCEKEKVFLKKMEKKYPNLEVHSYEVWNNGENLSFLKKKLQELQVNASGIPITIVGNKAIIGFRLETTGKEIEKAILEIMGDGVIKNSIITVPIFGEINYAKISLPLLTIILAGIDGFNPCAMWVLVMLISLLITIKNRKKVFFFGFLFIFVSALVYFLFMSAWLNLFLFLGMVLWVRLFIGGFAIIGGGYYLKEFFTNKEGVCKVSGERQKRWLYEKVSNLLENKGLFLAAIGISLLAFLVNLIELICSAGIPATYTKILSLSSLSTLTYYLYLLLYIFIFMLDDLLVFTLAIFTLDLLKITGRYSRYSHLIGGGVLLILGVLLIFSPSWLSFF